VVEVATGHYHSLALRSDGTVRAWGYNAFGQLGDGTTTNRRSPITVSGLTNVVHIAGGRDMSYAVRSDGTVWAWGLNSDGSIGDGTTTTRTRPVQVSGLTGVVAIAGGRDHGVAARSDGTVWTWGDNAYGQVGDGTTTDRRTPVQVSGLTNVVMVGAGAHHSYALRANGAVMAWGRNNLGQLGDGTRTQRTRPVQVAGLGSGAIFVGSGRDHGMAAMADGSVRAWGRNDFRQLGDGTTTNRITPIVVPGVSGAQEVHGGQDYSVASIAGATEPDTTPPSAPGKPAGSSPSPGRIDLAWTASTDDVSASLRYDVYRDGAFARSVTSASTGTVTVSDTGLAPGATHTYTVVAVDGSTNASEASEASDPIVVQTPPPVTSLFADDFSSGNLSSWTSTARFSIDATTGSPSAPSARTSPVNQTSYAEKMLGTTVPDACLSFAVNVAARNGNAVVLARLRTASDGPVARVLVSTGGMLAIRSDVSGASITSTTALGTGWHRLELCGTVGTAGTWTLYRDGASVVSGWAANTGTAPIGGFNLGDTSAKTWTANFDDVVLDRTPG
jgi:hypothetical protein